MDDEPFLNDPLNDSNDWNRTIELSEFNNKVEDTFLVQDFNNINSVLEYNRSNDVKLDIVHEPILLPPNVKTELPELTECIDNEVFQSNFDVKKEFIERVQLENRTEKGDYMENDVIIHKEIIYVDCLRSEDVAAITNSEINKLDAGILFSHCQMCNEEYKWYCLKCSMLSYILDKSIIDRSGDRAKKTIPNFLALKNSLLGRIAVYALKGIPKNIKFGPFEGLDPIHTTSGCAWKLKDGKLSVAPVNVDRSNWLQYVNCAALSSEQNLTIFQNEGNLYFRSSRKINAGEELLVYYGETSNSGSSDVQSYCYPVTETQLETVYACTFCCLGFTSKIHLHKHKTVCPNTENKDSSRGIVQCAFCKIHLDARENSEHHMRHCCVKYTWNLPIFKTSKEIRCSVQQVPSTNNDTSSSCTLSTFKCPKCKYNGKRQSDLNAHLYVYHEYKHFECVACGSRFHSEQTLKKHIKKKHTAGTLTDGGASLQYHTDPSGSAKRRQRRDHHQDTKSFECEVCNSRFTSKHNLNCHVIHNHTANQADGNKLHKCLNCSYQTDNKNNLTQHVRNKHVSANKQYECTECEFKTKYKYNLKTHLTMHVATPFSLNKLIKRNGQMAHLTNVQQLYKK